MSEQSFLAIEGVVKSFGSVEVLRGIDLEVSQGEVLALLGPSGSGKSTLLRILAGFETSNAGRLALQGSDFTHRTPQQRGFGMVFQSYALFPHLSVADNVGFGLNHLDSTARSARVESMLELVQMSGLGERGIDQISGGQQQRVALARALAPEPSLLLLDEPLSNLDPSLRDQTRSQLTEVLRAAGATTILVTHEQEEAFELGDRVAVLDQGKIEQVGTPEELYRAPQTPFVASFVGRSSLLPCTAEPSDAVGGNEGWRVQLSGTEVQLEVGSSSVIEAVDDGTRCSLWVRPEHLALEVISGQEDPRRAAELSLYRGVVRSSRLVGPYALVEVSLQFGDSAHAMSDLVVEVAHSDAVEAEQEVRVGLKSATSVRLLVSRDIAFGS